MATSLTETWSSSSSGSITSVTEYPSKYYRRHCRSEVKYAVAANPNEDAFFGNPNRFDSKTSTPRISEEPMFGRSNFCDRRSSTPKLGYHGVETTVQKFMESFQVAERQPRRLNLNEATDESGLAPRESFSGCKFCRKNGEPAFYYNSHVLKEKSGKVICPILSKYVCPLCGATGSNAHTRRYCKNENTFGRNRRGFV